MTPVQAISTCLRKYVTFSGHASRSEFWWFAIGCGCLYFALEYAQARIWGWSLKGGPETNVLTTCLWLLAALPFLAAATRRAQDVGLHPVVLLVPFLLSRLGFGLQDLARAYDFLADNPASGVTVSDYINATGRFLYGRGWFALAMNAVIALLLLLPTNAAKRLPYFQAS